MSFRTLFRARKLALATTVIALLVGGAVVSPAVGAEIGAQSVAAPRAVVPGSQADLLINVSGPSTAAAGDSFTYAVVVENNSVADADGATFSDALPAGATNVQATCVAEGGAECPVALNVSNVTVSGTLGLFPHLGKVTVTVTGNFPVGVTSVTNTATVATPAGVTDPDPFTNTSSVSTTLRSTVALHANKTIDLAEIAPGDTATYVVTFSNDGPSPANDATIRDMLSNFTINVGNINIDFTGCVATGGAVCPTLNDVTLAGGGYVFNTTVPVFPLGSSITITYTAEFVSNNSTSCGLGAIDNMAQVLAPEGLENTAFDSLSSVRTPAEDVPCPKVALHTLKTIDLAEIAPGDTATYTVSFANAGPAAADGATIRDTLSNFTFNVGSIEIEFVSCVPSGGAVCPTFTDAILPGGGTVFNTTVPTFPSGSSIVITYTAKFIGNNSTSCGLGAVDNTAQALPASGIENTAVDSLASVRTPAEDVPCPKVALHTLKTVDLDLITPGDTATYTVSIANDGPEDADGSRIRDVLTAQLTGVDSVDVEFVSCVTTGGAVCPTLTGLSSPTGGTLFDTVVPTFPNGSSLTITYTATFVASETNTCGSGFVQNYTQALEPAGMENTAFDNASTVRTPANCSEVTVNKTVSPTSLRQGQTLRYDIVVSNAGPSVADAIAFSDPISAAIDVTSVSCVSAQCGPVAFDPATRIVTSQIPSLQVGQSVTISIVGTAGAIAGTYTNTATVTTSAASTYYDIQPVTDSSQVNVQMFNAQSPVTIVKTVAGLPASGLPVEQTYTGTISCTEEGARQWSATVAAGSSTGSSAPIQVYDGQDCTITEDAPPAAPAGFTWSGAPVVSPSSILAVGPATAVRVDVTNTLAPIGAADPTTSPVTVVKTVAGLPAAGLPEAQTYTGSITCSVDGVKPWSVTVAAGESSAAAAPISLRDGQDCTVTEATPPAAPSGYVWSGAPVVSPSSILSLGPLTPVTVEVTNTLVAVDPGEGVIVVTKQVDGLPLVGLPKAATFGGTVACTSDEGIVSQAWSVTIPAGQAEGISESLVAPAGVSCVVSENTPPTAPHGFEWSGSPRISPASATVVAGQQTSVTVVNTLAAVVVPPVVAGLALTGLSVGIPALLGGLLIAGGLLLMIRRRAMVSRRS